MEAVSLSELGVVIDAERTENNAEKATKLHEMTRTCLDDVIRLSSFKSFLGNQEYEKMRKRDINPKIREITSLAKEANSSSTEFMRSGIISMLVLSSEKGRELTQERCPKEMKPYFTNFSKNLFPSHQKALLSFAEEMGIGKEAILKGVEEWQPLPPANVTQFLRGGE